MSRVAFVTGASSGIGRGLATRLGRKGWSVGLAARRVALLDEVAEEIRAAGGTAVAHRCDVASRDEVLAAVAGTADALGPVDLLVANAGVSRNTFVASLDGREVERMIQVNFLGCVYAAEAVLPSMLERRAGQIVVVGSLAGYGGLPLTGAYSAAKGALHNFFESLRIDLRGSGVAVTILTPGYVDTPMARDDTHARPFKVPLDRALDRMERAIEQRRPLLRFPAQLGVPVWLGQLFPARLYDALAGRAPRDKR